MKRTSKLAVICLALTILISAFPMIPASAASKIYSTGTYVVGKDIMPGEYIITPNSDYAVYYAIFGENGDIQSSDLSKSRSIVRLIKNQKIKLENADMVSVFDAPQLDLSKGYLPEGTYRVGIDIPANTYILRPNGDNWVYGTYEIYEVGADNLIKVIEKDSFREEISILVKNWQYFRVTNVNIVFPTPAPVTKNKFGF